MSKHLHTREQGPFRAEQLNEGDRYELSHGHPVYCAPGGRENDRPVAAGASARLPLPRE